MERDAADADADAPTLTWEPPMRSAETPVPGGDEVLVLPSTVREASRVLRCMQNLAHDAHVPFYTDDCTMQQVT
eukprot:gene2920-4419_t